MICLFPTPRRAAREQLSVCGARARVAAHSPPPFWGTARAGQLVSSTSFPEKQSTHSYPIPTMGYKRTNEDFPSSSAARGSAEWSSFACFSLPKNKAPHFFRHIPNYAGYGRTNEPLCPAVPLRAGARRMGFLLSTFLFPKKKSRSVGQALAAAGTTTRENLSAIGRCHSLAEAMHLAALALLRLIRS